MAQAEPFKKYIKREIAPGAHITSDEDLGLDIPHLCSATWVVDGIVDLPTVFTKVLIGGNVRDMTRLATSSC
jgi:hypothetical protein